jgi:prepilin-type N-terminal cleavage/methylation domain-containing protein
MTRARGFTLVELLIVLAVLGVLMGMSMPQLGRWRDAAAATGARDELAARLARTRVAAATNGGAALVLDVRTGRYRVDLGDGTSAVEGDLAERYGVVVESAGVQDSLVLRYDALGIGRMTGRTILLRRGAAVAGIVVSPYGRFRRW